MKNQIFIIAPSNSMADIPLELQETGIKRLKKLGFNPVFGAHVNHRFLHVSGTVTQRFDDLKTAVSDPDVCGIMAVFGGYNTNHLLQELEGLRCEMPKWLIGYSDVTALLLALEPHHQIQPIHGPGFASFCDPNFFDFSIDSFLAAIEGRTVRYTSPNYFASDAWYLKEQFGPRDIMAYCPWQVYQKGDVIAPITGGNLDTLCALLATPYFPDVSDKILFIESADGDPGIFQRNIVQLSQAGVLNQISGLIIGKNPAGSSLNTNKVLPKILDTVNFPNYPVLFDVHCSHVDPMLSIPLNQLAVLSAYESASSLTLNYVKTK